ncbi:D-3-phosphoglycerate dehydrogenase [Rhodovulum sp. ES.010]|uniref:phosphoglycerate dehydrogenase n=1 Tax=Rhodovulum sp. ES.010 TaxID=1882821 RepID=UPI00092B92DC|nr:phosphoglycerate dehydrogenase [Rhodovulum sp. ES.010]SIO03366.1 D-3-phosphoglycerate dehydrogenase [Rhodovulum sp. ES.010]
MSQVFISTVPFGERNRLPFELLGGAGLDYVINPIGRRLREEEIAEQVGDAVAIVAGTEPITGRVIAACPNLKLISRVGIGLDSVDLNAARERGIAVAYTPDAPAPAVAELTIGLLLSLIRHVHVSNLKMHQGEWHRFFGRRIPDLTIGVIGAGRIGGRVLRRLAAFGTPRVLVNDIQPNPNVADALKIEWSDKETIYREADVITLHLPMTRVTRNMIREEHLRMMKPDAMIINTSRGGIVNEADLARVLGEGHLGGAAIDVFENEPYAGPLSGIEQCLLTSHMGSMSVDCRTRMEIEATEEVVRFFGGKDLRSPVPETEYVLQKDET